MEKAYLKILTEGTASYQADGTEIYMSTELNMVDKSMKEIFGLSADAQASPELGELSDDDRQTLYNETMKFFEKLYGESTETYDTTDADSTETAGGEEKCRIIKASCRFQRIRMVLQRYCLGYEKQR